AQASPLPIDSLPLQADGEISVLPAGTHTGNFVLETPIHLRCAPEAVLDGGGHDNLLTIRAPGVTIEGCTLRNWGSNLTEMNAGIFVEPSATDVTLQGNRLRGPGFGIWSDGTRNLVVENNQVEGDTDYRSQDRGNGIHLINTNEARVLNNRVRHTRDGIYLGNSNNNLIQGNLMEDLRFGIHYMFSQSNRVIGNTTRRTRTGYALMQSHMLTVEHNRSEAIYPGSPTNHLLQANLREARRCAIHYMFPQTNRVVGNPTRRTRTGYALMQSHMLTVEHNRSEDDRNYGILMNFITYSTI